MKNLFSVLAFVFLSVVGVYGQQIDVSVGLPVGSNVDNRPAKVDIGLSGSPRQQLRFDYTPAMGDLQSVIETRLREMAMTFSPVSGLEQEEYGIMVIVESGPFVSVGFYPQQSGSRWVIPPEVLDVELNYGAGVGWQIDGVAIVEMEIVTANGTELFSSENGGAGASPCYLSLLQNSLGKGGITAVESRYAVPSLQKESGVLSGSTLTLRASNRYQYVTIDLLDGSVLDYSTPPPAFLKFPDPRLEIAKTLDGLEFSVTGVGEKSFVIESSVDFVMWDKYPTVELTSVVGKKSLRAKAIGASRFFRLRIEEPAPLKH